MPVAGRRLTALAEQDNPVGVRALAVVRHAPAVGGLRELLRVDQTSIGSRPAAIASRDDDLFEPDACRRAPRPPRRRRGRPGAGRARSSGRAAGHERLPASSCFASVDRHRGGVDAAEPAAQPVVARVVHDVEERRRGDDQCDASRSAIVGVSADDRVSKRACRSRRRSCARDSRRDVAPAASGSSSG